MKSDALHSAHNRSLGAGIVKRVALLLVVGLGLGTVLFFLGLELSGIQR